MINRLIIFGTGAALIAVWLYLSLFAHRRSPQNLIKTSQTKPEEGLVKGCFPWAVYYLQSLEYRGDEIVCRGHLRCPSDVAYRQIRENVQKTFGDRFLVLLKSEPNSENEGESEAETTRYIFVLIPNFNPQIPIISRTRYSEWQIWCSSVLMGLAPLVVLVLLQFSWDQVLKMLPILIIGLLIKELARWWIANKYKIKISLPFFIPYFSLVWHRSHIPRRQVLFDLAIAPNLVSLIFGIALVVIGMLQPIGMDGIAFDFKISGLMMGLHQIFPNSGLGILHPVAYAGWLQLNLMAISLIPISILDGGYIIRSMFGIEKMAIAVPIMRIVILGLGLVSQHWLIVVAIALFLLNYAPSIPLDDVTELNLGRDLLGIGILALGLAVLLPLPESWF